MKYFFFLLAAFSFISFLPAQPLNDSLRKLLDTVSMNDQLYRDQIETIQNKYGAHSKELRNLFDKMRIGDSINQLKVLPLLDKYGWPGAESIGDEGNSTLFLVVQHASIEVQEKYLPMMQDAVKNGRAKGRELALLQDRVCLRRGRKQIYGSQVGLDIKNNRYFVLPLVDPDQVDKRRNSVGLPPLSEYLMNWQITWNPDQYKRELPDIEKKYREIFGISIMPDPDANP